VVDDLVAAWEAMGAPRPKLVLAGGSGWGGGELRTAIARHAAEGDLIEAGFVDRVMLRDLYRGAMVFVYPSLYEGFGLPPLEAMACGTPVVCSNTSSLPEVVGDAALTVDPTNVESIAAALLAVSTDVELRHELSDLGLRRAAGFRWERTPLETIAAYESCR
jgi:glycosyltransferase involved in cell wall biosynthesis